MQQIILQPQTPDELRLIKQFAKVMKIKTIAVKETSAKQKEEELLDRIERSARQVKAHLDGKIKLKSARQLLEEL
ncbi:hypothetical protein IC229_17695 [Spirosoma sp. BT702]|uniref:Uncharacterized protein n=1 Tax=Spirosoma profusum TaxID=2771354 RepID=A0A926Y414_9BACT|nr:hypothetical protein [Spirosoma profusum]MBD2702486.1 hypothetical protein [Spirosoma profusum]